MATAIQKCRKCDRVGSEIHSIPGCGHTICKDCLPCTELGSLRGRPRKVISNQDKSIYRHGNYFQSGAEDNNISSKQRVSEPVELVNPTPGDCPVCQQRILCKNSTLNAHLATFHEFDWIKDVQDKLDPKTCAECPGGQVQEGKYRCLKCHRVLCEKCQRVHRQEGGHIPLSFDDIANPNGPFRINVNRGFDPLNCASHPNQELSHFCADCSESVCRLCLQFHEEQGHIPTSLDDGLKEMQKYVTDIFFIIDQYKKELDVEKDRFQRNEIDKDIAALKNLPEAIAANLRPDIDAAIEKLSQFKIVAKDQESKNNAVIAEDEIANLCALEKTSEIMHRGKEKNVCSQEERIIRLHAFLKSNELFVKEAQRSLGRLQKDSAKQLPSPVVIYSDPLIQLMRKTPRGHLQVVPKERVKGVLHHSTRNRTAEDSGDGTPPKLVSGTIWPAEGNGHVQIVVADANKKVMAFDFSYSNGIFLKWEKTPETSATLRNMKDLKAAWINQDGRSVTAVDVEGNVYEIAERRGHGRPSVTKRRLERAEVAYTQGDIDLPADHGYNLPKFLERKGILPCQVIGFGELDTFLVSGMHTSTDKPLILVSRGGDVDLTFIWPENDRPSRVWMDYEGFIYSVNTEGNSITRYWPDGRFDREVLSAFDQLSRPVDVAVDRQFMYVTEEGGNVKIFERVPGHGEPISEPYDN